MVAFSRHIEMPNLLRSPHISIQVLSQILVGPNEHKVSQRISGPPYNFIHGNKKEISSMRMKSMSLPMGNSDYIFLLENLVHLWD